MLATSHALAAGVILKTVPDPRISLPLAFASHFLLDLIPHWDFITDRGNHNNSSTLAGEKDRLKLTFLAGGDVLLGVGLTIWLFQSLNPSLLFLTIIFAQLPDWLEMPYYFWGLNFAPSIWAKKFQRKIHSRLPLPWGLLTQVAIIFPLVWWAIK